jgi:hypothetical protein
VRRSNRPESAPSGCTPWVGIANQSDHHTVPRQAPRAKVGRPIEGMVWMRKADKSDCMGAKKNTPPLPCATLPLNMSCNMWDGPGCFRLPSLRKACRLQPLRLGSQERLVRFKDFVADHAQGRVKPRSTASLFSTSSCQRAGGHLATRYPLHRSARARKNSSEKIGERIGAPQRTSLRLDQAFFQAWPRVEHPCRRESCNARGAGHRALGHQRVPHPWAAGPTPSREPETYDRRGGSVLTTC